LTKNLLWQNLYFEESFTLKEILLLQKF